MTFYAFVAVTKLYSERGAKKVVEIEIEE